MNSSMALVSIALFHWNKYSFQIITDVKLSVSAIGKTNPLTFIYAFDLIKKIYLPKVSIAIYNKNN